jgi:hypothetical protein
MFNMSFVLFQSQDQNRTDFNHSLRGNDFCGENTSAYTYISLSMSH